MNKLIGVALVSVFALASIYASGAELTDEDRAELRQRAQSFEAERAGNPDYQPGAARPEPQSAQPAHRHARAAAKKPAKKSVKAKSTETRRQKVSRKVRSLENLPGAFVRK